MQEIFQGFSNFIYFFLNGPFYMLFEQSIVKLCAIFAVFVKVRIVLRKQYFFVRYKTPSAFFANGVLVLSDGLYKYAGIAGCKRIRACVS